MNYRRVIETIVNKQLDTIGPLARGPAEELDVLEFQDDQLKFTGEPSREDVEELLENYRETQGKSAIGIARRAVDEIVDDDTDIDLPDEITPKKMKAEEFASAL
ncbi:MAG: hypothetical protein ABEJ75_03255 [Candidatus Nanohaloarchaea archaeon]